MSAPTISDALDALALLRTCVSAPPAVARRAYQGRWSLSRPRPMSPDERILRERFARLCLEAAAAARGGDTVPTGTCEVCGAALGAVSSLIVPADSAAWWAGQGYRRGNERESDGAVTMVPTFVRRFCEEHAS